MAYIVMAHRVADVTGQEEREHEKPDHVGDGLKQGAMALGHGVMDGVTGLVTKPMERIREEGVAKGLVHGIGQAL